MKRIYENWSSAVFPGFYESVLYNCDTLYNYEYGETPKGFFWDFTSEGFAKFQKETCEAWIDAMRDCLNVNPIGLKIGSYAGIRSPREYNFTTDKLKFGVEFNLNELKRFCFKVRRDDFDKYLRKNWSSGPGFWSFVPNSVSLFESEYKSGEDKESLIDVMVEWYLREYVDFEGVEMACLETEWERISGNVSLFDENYNQWEFEYNNGYVPTRKAA